jgi:hypothetical protein
MKIQLSTPYNGYTHAVIENVEFLSATIHFRLCHEEDAPRDELNTAPFAATATASSEELGAALASDINAELQAHA